MIRAALWKVTVATNREGEELVTELLGSLFSLSAVAYIDSETGKVTVTAYSKSRPPGWKVKRARLRDGLERIQRHGLHIGPGRITLSRMKNENWAESWKRHFKPIEIGNALVIKPSWSKRRPKVGQQEVILDPGLSFGTGHHATTGFCLREIVRRHRPGKPQSFLDIGTGSGILTIAAAKTGYKPVVGFDFDPEAVRIARANLNTNGLTGRVKINRLDITRFSSPAQYNLICANLISDLLVAERHRIVGLLRPGGVLVLAGILDREFVKVRKAFETMGLCLLAGRREKEWYSGSFQQAAS